MSRIFLARTEEQKRFREVLRSLQPNVGWFAKIFPTVAKLSSAKKEAVSTSPHIFLLYGEGGMGKTSLGQRFCELAREEFPQCFQVLTLDWEKEKEKYPSLDIGHDEIRPESVLEVIYLKVSKGDEGYFEKYRQVGEKLKKIEEKVDKEFKVQQGKGAEYAPILQKGLRVVLGLLRKHPNLDQVLGGENSKTSEEISDLAADAATNALVGWLKRRLTLDELRIYAKPHQQLAEALGNGLQTIAAKKPLVLLLDTYEIVDRLECDRVLRMVIKAAGRQVVWVIAGRADLANSYRFLQGNFLGYRNEFSENLYVYLMSEFSQEQVIEYFAHPEINVRLNDVEAESVKQFSLGIPYVVQLIAEMCQEGIDLATILLTPSDDRENESPSEKVIGMTSDRFLRYCIRGSADEKAIYAMAMMRRPDNDLLKAMLGMTDLEPEMRSLKARHSFILLEGKYIKLHNNLKGFLQDHLRCGLAGQSTMVRELSERAVAYLESRLHEWQKEFTDTADYFESDRIANGLLDLAQHKFWQDVEIGWRYAVPLFVESWQYNRDWQKQLLGVIEAFQVWFDGDSKKRLRIFTKGIGYYFNSIHYIFNADSETALLNELETLTRRGWLDGERKSQYITILTLQRGRFLSRLGKYSESLQIHLELEQKLSETALHLRKALATEYRNIGDQLTWIDDRIVFSPQAQIAYQHAVELNKEDSNAWYGLGTSLALEGENESATEALKKATQLDPKFASPYNGLGNVYLQQIPIKPTTKQPTEKAQSRCHNDETN
jgi:tetratricopeptide (TPR) repeat protein